jgi:hypothetical protein
LTQRIERLLDDDLAPRDERPRRWIAPLAAGALSGLVFVVPGVCAERGVPSTSSNGTDVSRCDEPTSASAVEAPTVGRDVRRRIRRRSLAREVAMLDESVALLESELSETREVLSSLEPDSHLRSGLESLAGPGPRPRPTSYPFACADRHARSARKPPSVPVQGP